MRGGMTAGMGLWMLAWGLFALVVLGLAVLGVAALVRHLSSPATPGTDTGRQPNQAPGPRPPGRAAP